MTTPHLRKSIDPATTGGGYLLIAVVLACFGLSPEARAVLPSPTPDGGYPGGNTAEGTNALFSLTTGVGNTANGNVALYHNTTGRTNTAIGSQALFSNTVGTQNTATGSGALSHNTVSTNTANGFDALFRTTTGGGNTAIGADALLNNTIGSVNIAVNDSAGDNLTTGSYNIDIGNQGVMGESHVIRIGTAEFGDQTATYIAGIFNEAVGSNYLPVLIDSTGKLGTTGMSSRRFKKEIKAMENVSEAILALKPVTFYYKDDKADTPQFGLIAEEVAKVNPELVLSDKEGKPYTVRYDAVNAMLLNEFLKEHKKVQEQEATITQQRRDFEMAISKQQKQIEALTAALQKVSAQLAAGGPTNGTSASKVVVSNQ